MERKVTIIRSQWNRGNNTSVMFNPETGLFDCFGFIARQCGGASTFDLAGKGTPEELPGAFAPEFLEGEAQENSSWANEVMDINDSPIFSETERELALAEELAEEGWIVEFVGD